MHTLSQGIRGRPEGAERIGTVCIRRMHRMRKHENQGSQLTRRADSVPPMPDMSGDIQDEQGLIPFYLPGKN